MIEAAVKISAPSSKRAKLTSLFSLKFTKNWPRISADAADFRGFVHFNRQSFD